MADTATDLIINVIKSIIEIFFSKFGTRSAPTADASIIYVLADLREKTLFIAVLGFPCSLGKLCLRKGRLLHF